ncbi:MAG TPA: single-stranded DNA-binding protein [Nostocaceae cyanobacterium]|nr:single-stranded DNA-binding protein [Nostocaceae cyanobacterium]
MTEEQLQLWQRQVTALERIADALDRFVPNTAPNYQRSISEFPNFDWSSINATVEKSDQYGAAVVSWCGYQFVRRSPSNKFGAAIWFSRCVGKNDNQNIYERLITFKPLSDKEAEPVPEKVQRHLG